MPPHIVGPEAMSIRRQHPVFHSQKGLQRQHEAITIAPHFQKLEESANWDDARLDGAGAINKFLHVNFVLAKDEGTEREAILDDFALKRVFDLHRQRTGRIRLFIDVRL